MQRLNRTASLVTPKENSPSNCLTGAFKAFMLIEIGLRHRCMADSIALIVTRTCVTKDRERPLMQFMEAP
jgi:hypothetical protein